MTLRILLVCEYPTLNGGEHSLLALVPTLRERGFRFTALAPEAGALASAFAAHGIGVVPLELHDEAGRKLPQPQIRERIATVIERSEADLVHANSLSAGRLIGPVCAAIDRPSISHLRDIIGLSAAAVGDLNCHSRLIAVSQATRDFHLQQGLAAERTVVMYNGVDLERFQPRTPRGVLHAELGLPRNVLLVGAIGQVILRKGFDVLVRAASQIAALRPNVHFVIAGERYSQKEEARVFEEHLRAECCQGSLAGRVHFLGFRADVSELLSELTLLAHPARQEPLGRVLLEAAAAGVPVVATDVGGTREIFGREAAALVPADDAPAMAEAVARLLDDEPLRRQMGAAGRRRIEEQFAVSQAAAALERHYREVAAGGGADLAPRRP